MSLIKGIVNVSIMDKFTIPRRLSDYKKLAPICGSLGKEHDFISITYSNYICKECGTFRHHDIPNPDLTMEDFIKLNCEIIAKYDAYLDSLIEVRLSKWDTRFLELAKFVSSWSKDPSTQVGAVIVDQDRRVVSVGYNGFPRGVDDSSERYDDRELKYKMIVHGERNAILFANKSVTGCTLYTYPFMPCPVCAGFIIQAGITRVVAPITPEDKLDRWKDDFNITITMFKEAGIELVLGAF